MQNCRFHRADPATLAMNADGARKCHRAAAGGIGGEMNQPIDNGGRHLGIRHAALAQPLRCRVPGEQIRLSVELLDRERRGKLLPMLIDPSAQIQRALADAEQDCGERGAIAEELSRLVPLVDV